MPLDRTDHILSTALWRFSLQALHLTTTADIAKHAEVSVGTLFRTFPTKEDLLDNVYAYAITQLQQPLRLSAHQPQRSERLKHVLHRWWDVVTQVAHEQPHLFAFWRLYRNSPYAAAPAAPLLGPFEPVQPLLERALTRKGWPVDNPPPASVMLASLAGQWTAALELVRTNPTCQADKALRQLVLDRAYAGWWQGLGLSEFTPAEDVRR